MHTPTKIILVDDHEMFLEGLESLFETEPNLNIEAKFNNGKAALGYLEKQSVDLVITDISMAQMDGITLAGTIKQKYPGIKTMILSTHNDAKITDKIIKIEVDGYLLKNAPKATLLKAINAVLNGETFFDAAIKEEYLQRSFEKKSKSNQNLELSKRELEILKLIAEEYTAVEIAEQLFISQNTVNTHRKNLLAKLEVKNTAGLVRYAVEQNIV